MLPDFADLVERYGPAVVNINTRTRGQRQQQLPGLSEDDPFFEFFRRFMPDQQPGQPRRGQPRTPGDPQTPRGPLRPFGLGSGFVVSTDGFIVTNAHVVENAEEITVRFSDKRELIAKVIGADTRSDVAVIKVEATGLPVVKIGDTKKLRVGEWVIAIGSPFGFSNTVTAGIVSATSRENLSGDPNLDAVPFIQTDVAVNPGNSGGPLLNMRGEVVGVNSSIRSVSGGLSGEAGSIGLGFAIPISNVLPIVDQLRNGETPTHARLGVTVADASSEDGLLSGAGLRTVEPGSAADEAGLEPGDVVTRVDGEPVSGFQSLVATIRGFRPGDTVMLTVVRGGEGEPEEVRVTLDSDEGRLAS